MRMPYLLIFLIVFISPSCGSDTNLNNLLFSSSSDKSRLDVLMQKGRVLYDKEQYNEALEVFEEVYNINKNNEDAAQQLAFTYLALAGISLFGLTSQLIKKDLNSTSSTTNASSLFTDFADLINISDSDIELLGQRSTSTTSFLSGLDTYHPNDPGQLSDASSVPRNSVPTLTYINKALLVICAFVDQSVLADDSRYKDCTLSSANIENQSQSYLIMALGHLVEALAFSRVLLFEESTETSSSLTTLATTSTGNVLKRADKIESTEPTTGNLTEYISAINEVKADVDNIFNTSDGSMLNETMVNLRLTVSAFGKISGIPTTVTNQIKKALSSLEDAAEQAGQAKDSLSGQTSALKQQLSKDLLTKVNTSVNSALQQLEAEAPENLDEQKAELCSAYSELAEGFLDSISAPTLCP